MIVRRCRSCHETKPASEFDGPAARACNRCRHEKSLRRCCRCQRRVPIAQFSSLHICEDCASVPRLRVCRRCQVAKPAGEFAFRGSICDACRTTGPPPRACLRCHETKPAGEFDLGPTGRRHRGVCRACLAAEADAKRRRKEQRQATWETADGPVRRCHKCREIKLVYTGFYRIHAHVNGLSAYGYECRSCQIARVIRRERKLLQDPARAAQRRASKTEQQRRWRARNQERAAAIQRAYRKRLMSDPDRHQRWLESQRIAYRLRRERAGHELRIVDAPAASWTYLPIAPLYTRIVIPRLAMHLRAAIGAIARDTTPRLAALPDMTDRAAVQDAIEIAARLGFPSVGPVADELGVSNRTINAWVRGERPTLRSLVVEEILLRVDMFWWELVEPGDAAYEPYRHAFEGDAPQRAAA